MTTFDISEGDAFAKFVENQLQEAVHRGLLSAGMRLIGIIQNEIIPAEMPPPVNNRHYAAGWIIDPRDNGDVHVKNTMPYAIIIEKGARAENIKIGRAMIDALTEWVITRGLVPPARTKSQKAQQVSDAQQIAWAIAMSMKGTVNKQGKGIFNRNGQQGLRIAEKAGKRAPAIVDKEVAREVRKALKP